MAAEVEAPSTTEVNRLSSGLMSILQPSVEALDIKGEFAGVMGNMRLVNFGGALWEWSQEAFLWQSQVALREQIDRLSEDLGKLNDAQDMPIDLEPYVKKLISSRRRITLVNNILQNAQERLRRLNQNITRETAKKKGDDDTVKE